MNVQFQTISKIIQSDRYNRALSCARTSPSRIRSEVVVLEVVSEARVSWNRRIRLSSLEWPAHLLV